MNPQVLCSTEFLGRRGFSPRKQTEGEDISGLPTLSPSDSPSKAGLSGHILTVNLNPQLEPVYYQFVEACPVVPVQSKLRANLLTL